jgi:hypothetical protein
MNKRMIAVAALAAGLFAQSHAAQIAIGASSAASVATRTTSSDPEAEAKKLWRESIRLQPSSTRGCAHASYPNYTWEPVDCTVEAPGARPVAQDEGVTGDYGAIAHGLISQARGAFSNVSVTSETGTGGSGAIDGANDYSVQLNTNNDGPGGNLCKGGQSGCQVWQQFVYSSTYHKGNAAVYMQYWLIHWGSNGCPKTFLGTWNRAGDSCWINGLLGSAPKIPAADLGNLQLTALTVAGGSDVVMLLYDGDAYSVTETDSVLEIASVWTSAEFNVVGDGGLSEAVFNDNASLTVNLSFYDGTNLPPTCKLPAGTTGETNNLVLTPCTATADGYPAIQFIEHWVSPYGRSPVGTPVTGPIGLPLSPK